MKTDHSLGGLDYGKFLAAFLVIAIHTSPLAGINPDADFLFTRILARIAVPLYLMVTGYFLLPQYLTTRTKDLCPLFRFLKKTLLFYGNAILLYLPVNFYAGHFSGNTVWDFLRLLLFDGTFYHLWYLPSSVLGVGLLFLCRRLPHTVLTAAVFLLYGMGLLGDSYYGIISGMPTLSMLYEKLFTISSYTRNGLFYAPLFLWMGASFQKKKQTGNRTFLLSGLLLSFLCMTMEGFTLHRLDLQRHDSMYLILPLCMYFLFSLLLQLSCASNKRFRRLSTGIYLIHPLMILGVRGFAKFSHTQAWLIENSLLHYIAVCAASFLFSWYLEKFLKRKRKEPVSFNRSWIEISRGNLSHNVSELHKLLPADCRLMPAVKADAYGHGATLIATELMQMGITDFCVATLPEAVELRRCGIKGQILILGYTPPEQYMLLRKYHLTQAVFSLEYAKRLNSFWKKIQVHVKIDTGMHRLGERFDHPENIYEIFRLENLVITGTFTHLCADESRNEPDFSFTRAQADAFYQVIESLRRKGFDCGSVHLLASYGLLNYPELAGDYARIGIALYGLLSSRSDCAHFKADLKPVLSIKSRIAQIKELHEGESAGYGFAHTAMHEQRIAILPIGYADGIPRALSCCHGSVLIEGKKAPIIGRICMDQMLVDITDIKGVSNNSIAVIIGKLGEHGITAYDLAEADGTITNEILSRLGSRLPRILVR